MSHGPISVFTPTAIASGASTSGEVNLSRAWKTVNLVVGTMSTAAQIQVFASPTSGGTFQQVYHPTINSATVATSAYLITTVGTSGGIAPVPSGYQFMKFATTAVVSGGVVLSVICSD